jgi:hypothetical protein
MTTRVLVFANHGEDGSTHIRIERRDEHGHYVHSEHDTVTLVGLNRWVELYLPDHAQIVVTENG